MPNLRPYQDVPEYEKNVLFAYSGAYPVSKGTFVKIAGSGWVNGQDVTQLAGAFGFTNPHGLSERWSIPSVVVPCSAATDKPIGMLLYDGKELDENGLPLKYNALKTKELNVFLSGQACTIVKRGKFLYSGITGAGSVGAPLYLGGDGLSLTSVSPIANTLSGVTVYSSTQVAKALGMPLNGIAMIEVDVQ